MWRLTTVIENMEGISVLVTKYSCYNDGVILAKEANESLVE